MNRRDIPGFYYDEEKKKYFAVQPNHKVPQGAKHSQDNVKREKQDAKKRKIAQEADAVLQRQTVQRNKVLRSSLLFGITLHREIGASRYDLAKSRDSAFARQLGKPYPVLEFMQGDDTVQDFKLHAESGKMVAAVGMNGIQQMSVVNVGKWKPSSRQQASKESHQTRHLAFPDTYGPVMAFNSVITGLAMTCKGMLVATALEPSHPGNVFIHDLLSYDDSLNPGIQLRLGNDETSLWCVASQPSASGYHAAIGSTDSVYLLDTIGSMTARLDMKAECRALDWLSYNVVAAGQSTGRSHEVKLWDIRTRGSSARFKHNNPITGILSANSSDQQLLVTSHDRISLYDVRGRKQPLLSTKHAHVGPRCIFDKIDFGGQSMVAALDSENEVQVYSMRTGQCLLGLGRPAKPFKWISRLRGGSDELGSPVLHASQDSDIIEWRWGGRSDDEG